MPMSALDDKGNSSANHGELQSSATKGFPLAILSKKWIVESHVSVIAIGFVDVVVLYLL